MTADLPDRDGYVTLDQASHLYQIAYDAGVRDTEARSSDRYWAGYADGVELMSMPEPAADSGEVDPEALAAVDRISRRLAVAPPVPAPHAHRVTLRPALRTRRGAR